jgi:hypothetical protein
MVHDCTLLTKRVTRRMNIYLMVQRLSKNLFVLGEGVQIVCADSYFASIVTAVKLKRIGLRFIGVVKSATRIYPRHMVSLLPMYRNRKVCWTGRKAEGFLHALSRGAG